MTMKPLTELLNGKYSYTVFNKEKEGEEEEGDVDEDSLLELLTDPVYPEIPPLLLPMYHLLKRIKELGKKH